MSKQTTHSSYWVDDTFPFDFDTDDINKKDDTSDDGIERVMKLASIRRAVSNFVRILTDDSSIQVKYSSGQNSFTDGKTVVISADHNPKNFDPMVGLALHEGSHCLLSDFNFLHTLSKNEQAFYAALHPELRRMVKLNPALTTEAMLETRNIVRTLRSHIHTLMNIIEDRRIDTYVYRMAPGYRPYYDAMYKKYFFNSDIEKNLQFNPEWRKPTVSNYVNWLINIFSPHFDKAALPGLGKMVKMIDLPNIRRFDELPMGTVETWEKSDTMLTLNSDSFITTFNAYKYEQFPLLWRVSNELMIEILKRVKFHAEKETNGGSEAEDASGIPVDGESDEFQIIEMESEELPNYDLPQKRFNAKKAEKAMEKITEILNQSVKKKKIKRNEEQQIDSMESANATMSEYSDSVYGKIPCLVTHNLTKQIMSSQWFPFSNLHMLGEFARDSKYNYSYRGFLSGIRMGQILAHRLQVRNDPRVTHFTRQEHGKIDRRILSQLGMDIENVFKRTTVESYNPVMLYLSVDASGSMWGQKWERVMTVMTALAYAADKINNLDVIISLRGNAGSGIPTVVVAYDSRKDNFAKVKALFPSLSATGSTPEGLCYPSTLDLMKQCTKTHTTYFINFSDGEPGCNFRHNSRTFDYGGSNAIRQTRNMVHQMRDMGVRIMSYFIGDHFASTHITKSFREMYGQEAEFVDVRNVVNVLKTLNKLLLVKE